MVGAKARTPWSSLFKKLEILPIHYKCIFSLMNFTVNLQTNSPVHSTDTGNKHHFHRPNAT
jgi:hypothetical protein